MKTLIITSFCLSAALLTNCASVETHMPVPSLKALKLEKQAQEVPALGRYETMLKRLDLVSAKILQENAELCHKTRPDLGIITHTKKSYSKHIRAAASRHLGASEEPYVFIVRKGSIADTLGIRPNDILMSADAKALSANDKDLIQDGKIQVRRGLESFTFPVNPPKACAYKTHLRISNTINAYANGKSIIVTTGMMDFAKTDDALALVVGHELAHNTMNHVPKSIKNYLLSGFATRYTRPFEAEADYVGLYYAARAGFDLSSAEQFWHRLGILSPKNIGRSKTHPTTPNRYLSIQLTRAEIEKKTAADEPIIPNFTKIQKFQKEKK